MSESNMDKDLNAATDMFKYLHSSLKSSFPVWEDFIQRGQKFQKSLEQMIVSFNGFLDGFARLSEAASQSQGAAQEIGNNMANLVRWHKGLELKIREINYSLSSKVLTPVSNRIDEWKKSLSALEKDHEKEMHKALKDAKESFKNTSKAKKTLESKRKKKDKSIDVYQQQFEQLQLETDAKVADAELKQKVHLSRIMVEERVWFCTLINSYIAVLDHQLTMRDDLERLPGLMSELKESSNSPSILPENVRDYVENWEIPSSSSPRIRVSSVVKSSSNPSIQSDSSTSIDISDPIVPSLQSAYITTPPAVSTPPTLGSCETMPVQQQTPPTSVTVGHGSLRSTQIEDGHDNPVPSAAVTVSPSQVSLVSTGSHQSSSDSSTRSISPPLAHRTAMPSHREHHLETQPYAQTQPYSQQQTQHYAVPTTTSNTTPTVLSNIYKVPRTQAQPSPQHMLGNQAQPSPQHILGNQAQASPQHMLGNQAQPSPQHVHVLGNQANSSPQHVMLGTQAQPSPQHVLGNQAQSSPQHQEPLTLQQQLLARGRQRSVDHGKMPSLYRTTSDITAQDLKYSAATLPRHRHHHPPSTKPKPKPSRAPSLPNHAHSDNEDEEESDFAKALRQAKLRKAATVSDRSAPKL